MAEGCSTIFTCVKIYCPLGLRDDLALRKAVMCTSQFTKLYLKNFFVKLDFIMSMDSKFEGVHRKLHWMSKMQIKGQGKCY